MIRIFLSIDNGAEVMELPVIPPEFSVSKPQKDETFETVTGEQLAFIDAPDLKGISWSSFFPAKDYPFLRCERLADVWQYGYTIDMWIKRKYPIRLCIAGTPINMAVKVTQFDYTLSKGGDINYSITLKEMSLVDTESEELTVAQYEELSARIDELSAKIDAAIGGRTINSAEDGAPMYDQAIQAFCDGGYINGTGSGLDLTEDMARLITIMYRLLKEKGIL